MSKLFKKGYFYETDENDVIFETIADTLELCYDIIKTGDIHTREGYGCIIMSKVKPAIMERLR